MVFFFSLWLTVHQHSAKYLLYITTYNNLLNWHRLIDLNYYLQFWRLLCYHYTKSAFLHQYNYTIKGRNIQLSALFTNCFIYIFVISISTLGFSLSIFILLPSTLYTIFQQSSFIILYLTNISWTASK